MGAAARPPQEIYCRAQGPGGLKSQVWDRGPQRCAVMFSSSEQGASENNKFGSVVFVLQLHVLDSWDVGVCSSISWIPGQGLGGCKAFGAPSHGSSGMDFVFGPVVALWELYVCWGGLEVPGPEDVLEKLCAGALQNPRSHAKANRAPNPSNHST